MVIPMKNSSQYLTPLQRKLLLRNIKTDLRPEYRLRIEIMLLADVEVSQAEICNLLGCSQSTARYWIYIAQAGKFYSWSDRPVRRPKTVSSAYVKRLEELVMSSPREYGYSFRRWTAMWLKRHLAKELGIEVMERHINRMLKEMGLSRHQSEREQVGKTMPNAQSQRIFIIRDLPLDISTSLNSKGILWSLGCCFYSY
jgi:transposase